ADLPGRRGEDAGTSGLERGAEHHRSAIVRARKQPEAVEETRVIDDRGERSSAARIDALAARLQIGPKDHGSVAVDDGEALEAAEDSAGLGDGDDRAGDRGEDTALARPQVASKGHRPGLVHGGPERANPFEGAARVRDADQVAVTHE